MSDDNNKFKNAKIYTIRNRNDETLIYVGSTVQPLYKRLSQHKKDSKNPRCENILLYKKMNETNINDWYIELYIDYPCERKEQLTQREGNLIREIGNLNKRIDGRTNKEYVEDNKEFKLLYNKKLEKEESIITIS
jgi:Uri superfamily endonuclease